MKPKSLANLKMKLATDTPGLTSKNSQVVSVRLHGDDVRAIAELSGDRSYHIRQAVKNYLKIRDRDDEESSYEPQSRFLWIGGTPIID